MEETQKYCPIIKGACLEAECSMYHQENEQCVIFTACTLLDSFQKILLKQTDSCLQMIDLMSILESQADSVNT